MLTRRGFLALPLWASLHSDTKSSGSDFALPSEPMSFDILSDVARCSSSSAYVAQSIPHPEILGDIDYGHLGQVQHRLENALFRQSAFPVTFFHLGGLFQKPVRLFILEEGRSREVVYRKALFEAGEDNPVSRMPDGIGFAGFRLHDRATPEADRQVKDWMAFLGASYFRSSGDEG